MTSFFWFFSSRTATLVLSLTGAAINLYIIFHLLALSTTLRWETESEWEGSEKWRFDTLRLLGGLLLCYFTVASMACVVGAVGVVKRLPRYVRLYRDYSLADLLFCALAVILFSFASFHASVRSIICEELSRQPDLMRALGDAGLNIENCESWFETTVVAFVCVMAVVIVIRLQFTLTITSYYTRILRSQVDESLRYDLSTFSSDSTDASPRRILLLPASESAARHSGEPNRVLVYAPVSSDLLSPEEARELAVTEAWVSRTEPQQPRSPGSRFGRISLPMSPEEPLFSKRGQRTEAALLKRLM